MNFRAGIPLLLALLSSPSFAAADKVAKFFIRPAFGMALPAFGEVRQLLRSVVSPFGGVTAVTDESKPGMTFGLELGYLLKPELGEKCRMGTSLRVGYLSGEVSASGLGPSTPVKADLKNTLISVTAGLWVQGGRDKGFHYRTGGGLGLGMASADAAYSAPGYDVAYQLSGMGLVFDLSGEWGYAIQKEMRIYLQAGYSLARIGKMGLSTDVDFNQDGLIEAGESQGSILGNTRNEALTFDFSGPRAQLGFAAGF